MSLPIERIPVERGYDSQQRKPIVPATAMLLDIKALQERAGTENGFHLLIGSLMEGLARARYRSDLVFWGWFAATEEHPFCWAIGMTPLRDSSAGQLCRVCKGVQDALLESTDNYLEEKSIPLLRWRSDGTLVRLWGGRAAIPDFRATAKARLSIESWSLARFPEQEERILNGKPCTVLNRKAQIEWVSKR